MIFALDSNTIVHLLYQKPRVKQSFEGAIANGDKFVVPKMADYEIRRGFHIKPSVRKEKAYDVLLDDCIIVEIDAATWAYAIPIFAGHYHRRHTADEMDILIAAICLQNDYTLVTNNAKDFQNISGLKWVDWS